MRKPKGLLRRILTPLPLEKIRSEIEGPSKSREKIPTSVEIPFTAECKRVLNAAAEEADRLLNPYIGPEHLFLAILRQEKSAVGAMLAGYGLRLDDVRLQIVQALREHSRTSASSRLQASERINQIKNLVLRLGRTPPDTEESSDLIHDINDALDALLRDDDPSS
jgi:ATP-dependent Clp protease ATP-binding subunit ClpA